VAQGIKQDEEYADVKPIEERHRINEAGLDRWMRQNIEDYLGPLNVLQFKGGQSNPTYRLDTPGASYVKGRYRRERQSSGIGRAMCPACKGVLEVCSKSWRNLKKVVGTISRSEIREQHLAEMLSRTSCHDRGLLTL
jgi:hypothetical protein